MPRSESHPQAFLETVLALLEERFPWLGKSEDEDVSGADTIEELSDLHENLAEQLAQSRSPCAHEEIEWGSLEIEYLGDRTAVASQAGTCNRCGLLCTIHYEPGDPEVVG
jgi:hypothetical protein